MVNHSNSYYDYDFSCKDDVVDTTISTYHEQIIAFNGGGP